MNYLEIKFRISKWQDEQGECVLAIVQIILYLVPFIQLDDHSLLCRFGRYILYYMVGL